MDIAASRVKVLMSHHRGDIDRIPPRFGKQRGKTVTVTMTMQLREPCGNRCFLYITLDRFPAKPTISGKDSVGGSLRGDVLDESGVPYPVTVYISEKAINRLLR